MFKRTVDYLRSLNPFDNTEHVEDDQEELPEDADPEYTGALEENDDVSDMIFQLDEDDSSTGESPPSPLYRAMQYESRCLSEVALDMFVAFEEDTSVVGLEESLRTPDEGLPFTHILKIQQSSSHAVEESESAYFRFDPESGVSTLTLIIPSSDWDGDEIHFKVRKDDDTKAQDEHNPTHCFTLTFEPHHVPSPLNILLSPYQLSIFRDFVAASGYNVPTSSTRPIPPPLVSHSAQSSMAAVALATLGPSPCNQAPSPPNHNHDTRILITTPRNRRTDAIAAAAYHLAWEMDLLVEDVVGSICDNDETCVVWRVGSTVGDGYELGDGGAEEEYVEIDGQVTRVGWVEGDVLCRRDVDWVESLLV